MQIDKLESISFDLIQAISDMVHEIKLIRHELYT